MSTTAPDTIVLVHGFWVTPRSWEQWIAHYESRGYRVIAPGYPGFEVEVESLNADTSPIEALTVPAIVEHLESVVGAIETPPIIMGHSAGGAFTQILLDHGFGAAGVALNSAPTEGVKVTPLSQIKSVSKRPLGRGRFTQILLDHGFGAAGVALNSAPTEGVKVTPLSQIKSTFPVLKNPANRHKAIGLSEDEWRYAFTNTFTEEESRRLYERYHVPASGRILWGGVLANFQPGHQDTWVDYRNADRVPLLFVSGSEDHIMPPSVQRSNAKHYKGEGTVTEIKEYDGKAHLLPAQEGWQEIADEVLAWAEEHAKAWAARPAATSTA